MPMEILQVDLVDFSSFKVRSKSKTYSYVLAMLDVFSRFLFLRPLVKKEAKEIAPHLESLFNIFGTPKRIQTDKGSEFKGEVKASCESLGIKKCESSAYHPQSQGKIERSHGTWKSKIKYDLEHASDVKWSDYLETYNHQYNTGAHQSLGNMSPFEVFFGRKPYLNKETTFEEKDTLVSDESDETGHKEWLEQLPQKLSKAEEYQRKASEAMIKRHKVKYPPSQYELNEEVLIKEKITGKKIKNSKQKRVFKGKIVDKKENKYKVSFEKNGSGKCEWFPVSHITSLYKAKENQKQAAQQQEKRRTRKRTLHSTYHLDTDKRSNISSKTEKTQKKEGELKTQKSTKKHRGDFSYSFRKRTVVNYLNTSFDQKLREAIKLSAMEVQPSTTIDDLRDILSARNLQTFDVPGDGNCFFYAISHQMYGTISRAPHIRELAVEEVIRRPKDFAKFLTDETSIDEFIDDLSTDRDWADNMAVQATSDALSIRIEIVNSNQEQFGGTRIIDPSSGDPVRHVIIGHIEQVHYVSTTPSFPMEVITNGGSAEGSVMKNTCSVDGPLLWLMLTINSSKKLLEYLISNEIENIVSIYQHFQANRANSGKLEWFRDMADQDIYQHSDFVDFFGSEGRNFFEPITKTYLAGVLLRKICKCPSPKEYTKMSLVRKAPLPFVERIKNSFQSQKEKCSRCRSISLVEVMSAPPVLVVAGDCLNNLENISTMINLNVMGTAVVYILVLITMYERGERHFVNYFRLNSKDWFFYDGLKKPPVTFTGNLRKIEGKMVGHFAYIQSSFFEDQVWSDEVIEVDLPIIDFSSDGEKSDSTPQTLAENGQLKSFDRKSFKTFFKQHSTEVKKLFDTVKVTSTSKLTMDSEFDEDEYKYDEFEDAKDDFRIFCANSECFKDIPLTTKATKFGKVFTLTMDKFFENIENI